MVFDFGKPALNQLMNMKSEMLFMVRSRSFEVLCLLDVFKHVRFILTRPEDLNFYRLQFFTCKSAEMFFAMCSTMTKVIIKNGRIFLNKFRGGFFFRGFFGNGYEK